MEYYNLGKTGLKVSALCLGSMQFGWTADEDTSYEVLSAAYEAGINFIDTADVYSRWAEGNPGGVAETIIGKWIKKNQIPRDQLVIATKVRAKVGESPNDQGLSRQHIFNAVENSLRRMQLETIDVYQAHSYDPDTPIEETLLAMNDLIRQGKIRYIGCSNYPAWRLMQALWVSDNYHIPSFTSLQPHYNLVHRAEFERELLEVCLTYGIGVIPYSPLAGGFLTGKYTPDKTDSGSTRDVERHFTQRNWKILDLLRKVAIEYPGASVSQVALAWLRNQPGIISPIIGPRNLDQLNDNLGAARLRLSGEHIAKIELASQWK